MANRDNYYIKPFENNWGITHTQGTSYYYKDYTDKKVRLIVMDVMLYTDNGSEAAAQNSWLSNLLDGAINNNLDVLIAIHAPHGGSTPIKCSFTKYNETTMPVRTDCNTPQSVIDIVSSKISNGLNFIGYIVGHTHQDTIWSATEDRSQVMYAITTSSLATIQWTNADIDKTDKFNAFNLISIDTDRKLVKIVRGGGCDIDDVMRPRKAICFDYSTGKIVGEVGGISEDSVNSIVNEKLGVIENGSY
jgi:hypothetical protein